METEPSATPMVDLESAARQMAELVAGVRDDQLDDLVAAWRDPAAWEGQATAGGITMPAAEMGVVALDELVLHGWDLAVATDQPFEPAPTDAPTFDRALGLSGRDPAWRPDA